MSHSDETDMQLAVYRCLEKILPTYPDFLPEKTPLPAAVYLQQGGETRNTACEDEYTADFRISIYAKTVSERAVLVRKVRAALADAGFEQEDAPIFSFDFFSKAHVAVLVYLAG